MDTQTGRSGDEKRDAEAGGPRADHYSYTVYADEGTAARFDGLRFGGPIGALLAETQERIVAEFLEPVSGSTVLDVGTGTGRAALALSRRGAQVTGVDASEQMLAVARARGASEGLMVTFEKGDAHTLAFADRTFDSAVTLRVLMHTPDWRQCLGELCRVARHRVVFDYPALLSVAAIQAATRRAQAVPGSRVEAYRVFSDQAIRRALMAQGFRVARIHRQFVLPIAFHKAVGSRRATECVERVLSGVGLRALFGSPVTVLARRVEPHESSRSREAS